MNLLSHAKNILVAPRREWPVIAAEPSTGAALYTGYIGPLAVIAPVATFIGLSIIGISMPFIGTYRISPVSGLFQAALAFVFALAGIYVLALIINALAPKFGGEKNPVAALKVAGYASTPTFIAGIFLIFPMLSILQLLAALYGLYLLYVGLPVLMKSPQQKALPYTGTVIACAIVLGIVVGVIMAVLHASVLGGAPPAASILQNQVR